ncbi:hypothetical protein BHE74_00010376 [Ensete ventricosum]|nr:hypothetical protein BHE74_00010376 [Ensete ventricosum]
MRASGRTACNLDTRSLICSSVILDAELDCHDRGLLLDIFASVLMFLGTGDRELREKEKKWEAMSGNQMLCGEEKGRRRQRQREKQ